MFNTSVTSSTSLLGVCERENDHFNSLPFEADGLSLFVAILLYRQTYIVAIVTKQIYIISK